MAVPSVREAAEPPRMRGRRRSLGSLSWTCACGLTLSGSGLGVEWVAKQAAQHVCWATGERRLALEALFNSDPRE